jgi:hypothetical protein
VSVGMRKNVLKARWVRAKTSSGTSPTSDPRQQKKSGTSPSLHVCPPRSKNTLHLDQMSSTLSSSSRRISISRTKLGPGRPQPQQSRNAHFIYRPRRPYVFTQLVMMTDGSSYLHRTTSPQAVFRATKDVRNSPLWNPSSQKLLSVEEDEAGKLRSFRSKFGRSWDAEGTASQTVRIWKTNWLC